MKVCLDEMLSYRLANALKAFLANRSGLEVTWVRDSHPPSTEDPTWLKRFAEEGGRTIISGDDNIIQHWPNLIAYTESGLVSFFPPPGFQHQLSGFAKAALMIRWWPALIEKAKASSGGSCWRFPMSWTPDVTKFEELKDPRVKTEEGRKRFNVARAVTIHQFRGG